MKNSMTKTQRVHSALIGHELDRAEIRAATGLKPAEIDSALCVLLKAGVLRANGVPPHRTYMAISATRQDNRGRSAGSRASIGNLELSPSRQKVEVKPGGDYFAHIYGGPQPRPVLKHALDIAFHPFSPILAQQQK